MASHLSSIHAQKSDTKHINVVIKKFMLFIFDKEKYKKKII